MGILLLASSGCGEADDPRIPLLREKYLLSEEPLGGATVLDLKESGNVSGEVILVGRIGGIDEPWTKGKASFVVADPSVLMEMEQAGHACTGDNCPFCKKKQDKQFDGLAVVEFADDNGEVTAIDARRLFDLTIDQTVVVKGLARLDKTGGLIVRAMGMYVRR